MDKSEIISILNDWNYWDRDLPNTKSREFYDSKIERYLHYGEIVVIKGIRRSGKSTLMVNQIKKLVESGIDVSNILFVNLEDPRFIGLLSLELLENIKESFLEYLSPKDKPYIFLDEIQNISNWEKWVNKEYELKLSNVIISGSNSSMLSSEIASTISGRYLEVDVYPLSFKEFLEFKDIKIQKKLDIISKKIEINRAFEEYIKYGAFPKVLEYKPEDKRELLNTYKNTILLKDIVARYRLKDFKTLEEIAIYLLSNSGVTISINRLKNIFKVSYDMAKAYVEYLCRAYMIFEVNKFDYSLKRQNLNDKKYYSIDTGLSNILRVPNLQTRGSDIESAVFIELLRRGFKVYYYKTANNLEIDFIVQKEQEIVMLIQVTKSLKDKKTKQREIRAFEVAKEELKLNDVDFIIICEDRESSVENKSIKVVNLVDWLVFEKYL